MRPTSAAIAFALIALTARLAPSAPADAPIAGSQRSILVRGAYPVRGLPFFAANALPALVGDYSPAAAGSPGAGAASPAAPADVVTVWFTREALVLGSSWKRTSFGGLAAYVLTRGQGAVLGLEPGAYYLFFVLPAGSAPDDPGRIAFAKAFDRKFSAFFDNAPTDAELSFPAYVDY